MKKTIAVIVALIMVISAAGVSAAGKDDGWSKLPVVLVCGYAGPQLAEVDEQGLACGSTLTESRPHGSQSIEGLGLVRRSYGDESSWRELSDKGF